MGMFSWYTQDTDHRIVHDEPFRVVMTDDKGNQYVENCYEGYGVFGGKDYYELLAEMNGWTLEHFNGNHDQLRGQGIALAFEGDPHGMNPNVKHPSLTESGEYMEGEPPAIDPDQGFTDKELYGDYYDFDGEEE